MFNHNVSSEFKYRPRLKLYTNGTKNYFNKDTMEAVSYNWWVYFKVIKGKNVFNDFDYSNTTTQHQYNLRSLLKKLRIRIDLVVCTSRSLDNLNNSVLENEYKLLYKNIELLKTSRDKKSYNKNIKINKKRIKDLRSLGLKVSRSSINRIKEDVINENIKRLEENRERNRVKREKKKMLTEEQKSLAPLDLNAFNNLNDLSSIKL